MKPANAISASIIRVRSRTPFFGALAMFVRHELSEAIPTACTDGKTVTFNPGFVAGLSSAELAAVMLHELLHAALLHAERRGKRDALIWNVAADIVVNGIIRRETGRTGEQLIVLPDSALVDPELEDLEVEEVYEVLLQRAVPIEINWIGMDVATEPTESSPDEVKQLEGEWRQAWRQAATTLALTNHGRLPAGLRRLVDAVTAPQLDWRTMLWRHVVRTPVDYGGFDRRHVSRGLYLEELEGESVNVRVAVDTSGSVGQQDLGRFVAELREIIRLYPHINASLYFADAQLCGPYRLTDDDLQRPEGGGGTSFVPFFEEIEGNDDVGPDTLLVYLTDGFGKFPERPPAPPVLWVVTPGGLATECFPFGQVCRLRTE